MASRITYSVNGEFGIEGIDLTKLPAKLYSAVAKLKDYENTGLSPDEVEQLSAMQVMNSRRKQKFISVLIKEPGKKPRRESIPNTLEALQKVVGGYIETVTFASDVVIICNEEGRLKNLPYNCNLFGIPFVGTIIFAGVDGEDFADLPDKVERFLFKERQG